MAEKAFAFWQEKDRDIQQQSARKQTPGPAKEHKPTPVQSKTFPARNPVVDPSELYRPLKRGERPHSVSSTSPRSPRMLSHSHTPNVPTIMERGKESEDEQDSVFPPIQSAPPTLEHSEVLRRESSDRARHQSVGGFVSYLDGPLTTPSSATNQVRERKRERERER